MLLLLVYIGYRNIPWFIVPAWAHLGPTGPRWAPCWPHEFCYLGICSQNYIKLSLMTCNQGLLHGPLTRYVKLQVAHAPGMPGTFSPTADFKWNRWLAIPACITARAWRTCRDACRDRSPAVTGKTFPAFPAHAHPQFCVSGKRPMSTWDSASPNSVQIFIFS